MNCSSRKYPSASLTFTAFRRAVLALSLAASPLAASAQNAVIKVPPIKIPLDVKGQPITITASAILTVSTKNRTLTTLHLQLTGDLSDLQANLTSLLSSQLDKDDRCGDRIAIQNATLTPTDPASQALVQLHVERWVCIKALGKQVTRRLINGDAQLPITLTPAIDEDGTSLRLVPEVGEIQADGSLGELLRSGLLGDTIREKVHNTILSALQKGTDLNATLPPAVQGYVTIQNAQFKDAGDGRLLVVLDGEARITQDQIRLLSEQVKERTASR
ncbi:hypothetical protein EDE15_2355 [Edaphobacter aggregans]|uniref:Uncharacterized protein n=1 Tax=Edaphobacter aggregans TaxID=570835 RepID=A0A428MIZ0_9BACT|nr:hypothetical protein [Edaphobacter aggregans]RSL16830.1 hypothetical protein EDE15_2355 [Edaphobacter aggregans]